MCSRCIPLYIITNYIMTVDAVQHVVTGVAKKCKNALN
jgi:hypothetical protein